MSKYNKYLYIDEEQNNCSLLIWSKNKPSEKNIPKSGTWIIREWMGKNWHIPCFPEITWGRLKRLKFICKLTP